MLETILHPIEDAFDTIKFNVKKKFNLFDPIFIYTYRAYGYKDKILINGRVLEKERVVHGDEHKDTFLHNIWRFYKRYESDEIPGVKLQVTYKDKTYTTTTNEEGFYKLEIPVDKAEDKPFWDKYKIKILESPIEDGEKDIEAEGEIMLPDSKSDFGIISDVDDTILESHITNAWLKIKTLALNTASDRVAFPGVAALYRGLVNQMEDRYKNPLWFVSGSSWNLYDLLDQFCEDKEIPRGPFLLRELSIDAKKFIKNDSVSYKVSQIRPLMKLTDPLPFIFIGDSGQKDPEIYKQIAEEFPGRVKAIYIRDVTPDERDKEVKEIAKELKKENIDMILAETSLEAAKHAYENNWISEKDLNQVKEEVESDKNKK